MVKVQVKVGYESWVRYIDSTGWAGVASKPKASIRVITGVLHLMSEEFEVVDYDR